MPYSMKAYTLPCFIYFYSRLIIRLSFDVWHMLFWTDCRPANPLFFESILNNQWRYRTYSKFRNNNKIMLQFFASVDWLWNLSYVNYKEYKWIFERFGKLNKFPFKFVLTYHQQYHQIHVSQFLTKHQK